MLAQFISMIRAQIDKAIYVWGGQGEVATEALIRRMETSTTNANRAIKLLNERKAQGIEPLMFDCSGLIIWAFQALGLISYDTTAEGIRRLCKTTTTPRVGDFAFSSFNSHGQAGHVGIITRPGYVTEAKGRDHGVVELPLQGWTQYGENPFIKGDVMLQRGDKGNDVKLWQSRLMQWNKDALPRFKADGDFGGETDDWTKRFQVACNLTTSGIVDVATWNAMVGALAVDTSAKDARIASLTQELANISNILLAEKDATNRVSNELYAVKAEYNKVVDAVEVIQNLEKL